MLNDGPKRAGRFLKKGSKVMERVSLEEFSFKEIRQDANITLDNAGRTIIHSKYHDDDELERSVRAPKKFNDDLTPQGMSRPVIFPIDFTKDWERDKKLRRHRSARNDDDDMDFDYEAALAAQEEAEAAEADALEAAHAAAEAEAQATGTRPAPAAAAQAPEPQGDRKDLSQYQSMDVVGAAIKSLMPPGEEPAAQTAPGLSAPRPADAFIPVTATPAAQAQDAQAVEAEAVERYRQQMADLKAHEERLQKEIEEARAQGYRDGFKLGEEKAELQVRQNAGEIFGKVHELVREFHALKQEVLTNAQENFYELAQAMAEALFKREFSLDPATFTAVIQRAIAEAIEPSAVKIKVHPDMYDRIVALGQDGGEAAAIVPSLVKDPEMQAFDFRVESSMSVVDVNVRQLVTDLLAQADIGLFDQEKKAG
jgi:flagellar biosynthesis/type III secretory pathway protein FliH